MALIQTGVLHYSSAPVVGGVEAVINAHGRVFLQAGYPYTVIAGRGDLSALPEGAQFIMVPELDSQYALVEAFKEDLEAGSVPDDFEDLVALIADILRPIVGQFDNLIIHNVLTKHFNLPLTAALIRLLDEKAIRHCIYWGHDFSWTSPHSRPKVHAGYPWELLKAYRLDVTYVAVSARRRQEMADMFGCPADKIHLAYNGVNPKALYGLTEEGYQLINQLNLLDSDLNMIMPVRVTQAKNIEFALHLVAALKAMGVNVQLVLTGPPDPHEPGSMEYFRQLQDLRSQLKIENEMHFVYELGPQPGMGYLIDYSIVGDLLRVGDVLLMSSHREGFGMPVLEAGLLGMAVVSTPIPAAEEIGSPDVIVFDPHEKPEKVADMILNWAKGDQAHQLKLRVRQNYTWEAIFRKVIEPLLKGSSLAR